MNNIEWKLRGHFVCKSCQEVCGGCTHELDLIEKGWTNNEELYPRKQLIGCLGKYCDDPCELQEYTDDTDLTIEHLIRLCEWMGNKLNNTILKQC